jgi:xylulose-5-phosphate/fructose-6-phosphate phosphoketolase
MCVLNQIDRFNLVRDVIRRVLGLASRAANVVQLIEAKLAEHTRYIYEHGIDMPEILGWRWGGRRTDTGTAAGDTAADN